MDSITNHTEQDCLYLFPQKPAMDLLTMPLPAVPSEIIHKASAFRKLADRNNYLSVRWILWQLAVNDLPDPVFGEFMYHSNGKPFIPGFRPFSISHSDTISGVLVTASDCGLDLEKMNPVEHPEDFSNVLSGDELAEIKATSEGKELFYYYWTLREALAKFSGKGISELQDIPNLTHSTGQGIQYAGSLTWPETFRYDQFLVQCIRSGYREKPPPLKTCICFPGKDALLRIKEIVYLPSRISLLTGEGNC